MKILLDARYLDGRHSGIGMYSEQLIAHMAPLAPQNTFECLVQPGYRPHGDMPGNVRLLPYPARPLSLKTVFSLHRLIGQRRADLFHALFPVTPIFYRGPMVVTVHDLQPLQMKSWTGGRPWPVKVAYDQFYHWMYRRSFARASTLISVSRATANAMANVDAGLKAKTTVIHSGLAPGARDVVDPQGLDRLKKVHGLPENYLLYYGSTRPNKNLVHMLDAFARLKASDPSRHEGLGFVLVLSPDRFMGEILATIDRLRISSWIHILKPISHEEKITLLKGAKLLYFVTKYEGFGFPLLEAQAQGLAALISDLDALPEVASDSALAVNPDDPQAMAEGLSRLLDDEALRQELIQRGYRNLERFSWAAAARATLAVYDQVCL